MPGENAGVHEKEHLSEVFTDKEQQQEMQNQQRVERNNQDDRSLPLIGSKTDYNKLKEAYDSDGLSKTWTGNVIVSPGKMEGDNFTGLSVASSSAKSFLRNALLKQQTQIESIRTSRVERYRQKMHWNQLKNNGNEAVRGTYHWLEAINEAQLNSEGNHVLINWQWANPGETFLNYLNQSLGLNLRLPLGYWLDSEDEKGVNSAAQMSEEVYLGLCQRYAIDDPVGYPQTNRLQSATIANTPQQCSAFIEIEPGFVSEHVKFATFSTATSVQLLIGDQTVKLTSGSAQEMDMKGISGKVPFLILTDEGKTSVTLTISSKAVNKKYLETRWKDAAFTQVSNAYYLRKKHFEMDVKAAMAELCESKSSSGMESYLATQLTLELVAYCNPNYPPKSDNEKAVIQQLQYSLNSAIAWDKSCYTLSTDKSSTNWLPVDQQQGDFIERLFFATAFKVSLPVKVQYTESFLYMLRNNGRFWMGEQSRCPVLYNDRYILKLMATECDKREIKRWQFTEQTCHTYLNNTIKFE